MFADLMQVKRLFKFSILLEQNLMFIFKGQKTKNKKIIFLFFHASYFNLDRKNRYGMFFSPNSSNPPLPPHPPSSVGIIRV